jgi:hypothetical protein
MYGPLAFGKSVFILYMKPQQSHNISEKIKFHKKKTLKIEFAIG